MKMNCDVIRDLLPLYADEVCSEASKALVEEHLQSCERCGKELSFMQGDETNAIAEEVNTAQAAQKAWKKNKLRNLLLGLLVAAILFGVGYGLTVPNILPVDERYLRVDDVIYHPEQDEFTVKLTVLDGMKHNFIRYRQVGDSFYITPMRPVITTREDPDWVEKKNTVTHRIGGTPVEKKLYVGWGDDAVLVWDRDWETEDFHKAYSDIWDVETQVRSE